jgi:hypothetical protein
VNRAAQRLVRGFDPSLQNSSSSRQRANEKPDLYAAAAVCTKVRSCLVSSMFEGLKRPFQIPEENYLGPDFDPEQHFLVTTSSAMSSLPPSCSLSRSSLPSSLSWPCDPLFEHLVIDLRTYIDVRNVATIPRKQIDSTRRDVCC